MAFLKEVLGEHYGRLGRLGRSEWKKKLHSNEGLFRRTSPLKAPGPTLDNKGVVIADMLVFERAYFSKEVTREQLQFYEELESLNPIASKEYMLTIISAVEQWKKDVRWLKIALHYLKKREKFLREEAALLQQADQELPDVIKRHFPQLFFDIRFVGLNVPQMLQKIQEVLHQHLEPEERYLDDYLLKLQLKMPFLFED